MAWLITGVQTPTSAQAAYPFNGAVYKASHNSYQRIETLAQQIDEYNVWQIELDICLSGVDLVVDHDCNNASHPLASMLSTLVAQSRTAAQKFTVIYFDLKENWSHDAGASPDIQVQYDIASIIQTEFGSHLYTPTMLAQAGDVWPSFKDLVAQGYNWAVVVDWHGAAFIPAFAKDPKQSNIFTAASNNPPLDEADTAVLVNVPGGCDDTPTKTSPPKVRGRWLYRYWPACTCDQLNGAYWKDGVVEGYNFVATNCINRDNSFQPQGAILTQSPQPLFVEPGAIVTCPVNGDSCEWGTTSFPFHDLGKGLQRASPLTTVTIQAGDYLVAPMPLTLTKPLTLTAMGGAVQLH